MVLVRRFIATGFILLLLPACATHIRPADVKEYHYFPEYDGYLPIVLTERKRLDVHADWVSPTVGADGKLDLRLPSTAEQAKTIVTTRTRQQKKQTAALLPVQMLAIPLILPTFLVADSLDHMSTSKRERDRIEAFARLAGVTLTIRITDEKSQAIIGAQVHELPSTLVYRDYTDSRGIRSFAAPQQHYYNVPARSVKLRARYLPVSLGRANNQESPNYLGFGSTRYGTKRAQNNSTEIRYVSNHFKPYVHYTKQKQWQWIQSPGPQTLYLVAWAPGFAPKLVLITGIQPQSTVTRNITLIPLPNRRKLQRATEQLNTLLDNLFQGKYKRVYQGLSWDKPLVTRQWMLPSNKLVTINQLLVTWLEDQQYPSYFRWNIYQILKDVARYTQDAEAIRYSKRYEKQAKKWAPYLSDGPMNQWRFLKAFSDWEIHYCDRDSNPLPRTDTNNINREKIKALLKTGEALDANNPNLDELRVSLALENGQRAQAYALAKHLGHSDYFRYFYGCEYTIWAPRLIKPSVTLY